MSTLVYGHQAESSIKQQKQKIFHLILVKFILLILIATTTLNEIFYIDTQFFLEWNFSRHSEIFGMKFLNGGVEREVGGRFRREGTHVYLWPFMLSMAETITIL